MQDVAQEVGIRVLPTFIAFKDGKKFQDVIWDEVLAH
jgi:thioredoxin-like negative regulator of GroEL